MAELDVTKILRSYGAKLAFEENVVLEPMRMLGEEIVFDDSFAVSGSITNQGETFLMEGQAKGTIHAKCSLCGDDVYVPMEIEISESLIHHPNRRMKNGNDKSEADFMYEAERDGAFVFTTHMLDLTKIIGDNVFLNLPSQFFCKADCKGVRRQY